MEENGVDIYVKYYLTLEDIIASLMTDGAGKQCFKLNIPGTRRQVLCDLTYIVHLTEVKKRMVIRIGGRVHVVRRD